MSARQDDVPSISAVNKAGERLKRFVRDGGRLRDIEAGRDQALRGAVSIARSWRRSFTPALTGVNMGVRSMIKTCGAEGQVGQRHKRLERIVQKLTRPNSSRLATMQDIAGVRAIFPDVRTLRRCERHVRLQWTEDRAHTSGTIVNEQDYITAPRASGYRAVHLIVDYNGRPAELQLRTSNQHAWAEIVETVSRQVGIELKAGDGPEELMDFFAELGELVGRLDDGENLTFARVLDLAPWGIDRTIAVSHQAT